jgi:hypothetical protein
MVYTAEGSRSYATPAVISDADTFPGLTFTLTLTEIFDSDPQKL